MTRNSTLLFALFALVMLAGLTPGTALAQTPDGETPAVEVVCADESGAAFGLCNAYCEAMDCHLAYDDDPDTSPSASANACKKVQNRFVQFTGRVLSTQQCGGVATCQAGTEGCPCADEYFCDGEMYCDEETEVCSTGGGDEF